MLYFAQFLATVIVLAHGVEGFHSMNKVKSRLPGFKMAAKDHEFTVAILGDLHLDPRYMEDHVNGNNALTNTNSLTYSLTYSLIYSLTHSLTHSPTHSLTHSSTHSLTHSPTYSRTHSSTHSPTHSLRPRAFPSYLRGW